MRKFLMRLITPGALLAIAASAQANFNGIALNPRVFNDHPETTLAFTTNNTNPGGSVSLHDAGAATTGGANRHDALMSGDGGLTAYTLDDNIGFTIQTTLVLSDGANGPRKEAGLRINAPVTGDVLFLVNSDAGEIVAFGGGAPFHIFGSNGNGNGYVPGTPITMGMTYTPGAGGTSQNNPGTLDYFVTYPTINGGATLHTGPQAWSNLEGGPGPSSYSIGVYGQWGPASPADFIDAQFTNISASVVPEPASLGALALAGLALLNRRR